MKKNIFDQLDDLDQKILTILMQEGRTPYAEIGKLLHVSPGTVHVRIKKLTEIGVIIGNQMTVDYKLLGYDICSFLGIYLEKSSLYDQVSDELKKIPEVVSAHYT
ncbi:MAG TPA: AsnC family transcriptional regulator, partial [Saprospiraceae bacterium]|nr:AsnC family transcriptional regulator [Saprospiraceae bacterium]